MKEKLNEFAQRGSMKSICYLLDQAASNGSLNEHNVFKDMLETSAKNFHVKGKNGKLYKAIGQTVL